jgi:nucleoside-diphosphate-sugar epimerase
MNVLLIGGTGFLGYYAVKELTKRGHQISILALPPLPAEGLFPVETKILLADLNTLSDEEVLKSLRGQDAVVYAAGADDRITPKAPAYPFFFKHNVEATRRLITLARQAGVKKAVVLGSYFVYFVRIWASWRKRHVCLYSGIAIYFWFDAGAQTNLETADYLYSFDTGRLLHKRRYELHLSRTYR